MKFLLVTLTVLLLASQPANAIHDYPADSDWLLSDENNTNSIDHSQWQLVLDKYVIVSMDGVNRVDYRRLQKNREPLDEYLTAMSKVPIRSYSRAEQFAYWVNLYNALTLQLVVDHYPVSSIRRIHGGLFGTGPWDEEVFSVSGKAITLNDIEHRILRPIWQDHRIHFVVNCASVGCPNLAKTALSADNANSLMQAAAREFLLHPRGIQVDGDNAVLSKIFDWYKSDFGQDQRQRLATLRSHIAGSPTAEKLASVKKIRYRYDWDLNDVEAKP
jgi:hypothetical protein